MIGLLLVLALRAKDPCSELTCVTAGQDYLAIPYAITYSE